MPSLAPASPSDGPQYTVAPFWAWFVVALLVPVALLNYLDRQMMAVMRDSIASDISELQSKESWGIMLARFKWTYACLSPFAGWVADRTSKRWIIGGSLFVWSAVTFATGLAQDYHTMLFLRALMGVSEAFYIPTALALIAELHIGKTRSSAVGLHQMGIYAGILCGSLSGFVSENPDLGWRLAFKVCGWIGVLYALPLVVFLAPRTAVVREERSTAEQEQGTILDLLTNRNFILLVLYFTLPAIAGWVVKDWMPSILKEKFRLGEGTSGFTAVVYVQIASLFGVFLGGMWADRWMRRSIRGRIFVSAIGMSCFIPSLFGIGGANSLLFAIACLILFGLGWGLFDCNNMPILCQITRPSLRATGYGIMNFVSISAGGFADWQFGSLTEKNVPVSVIFGVFSGIAIFSVILVLLIRPQEQEQATSQA